MILNAEQIADTQAKLRNILAEQEAILDDTDKVIITRLSAVWECQAQKAYQDAYIAIKNGILTQIKDLIALFGTAFEQSQNGLYQVNVDLSTMNATAIIGD